MLVETLIAPLRDDPGRSALVFDVDGTLAPIVPRPELATVPPGTQEELARLRARYLLVACLSGRSGDEAARLVGVPGLRYVGNHGLELHPDAGRAASEMERFRRLVEDLWPAEDKLLTLAFHFRESADEDAARETLEEVARLARDEGLEARFGRKVLDVRPRLQADKGTALQILLAESGASLALYAGDDTTDLDAFRGLAAAKLDQRVAVAVSSAEAPALLLEEADIVVDGPGALTELLRAL